MNKNAFEEVVTGLLDECRELLIRKGGDYSPNDDKLQNFKQAADFTSCNKWQALEIYLFKHLQAISNWFKSGRKQLNEDIKHRIRDSINYFILLEAMIVEEEQDAKDQATEADNKTLTYYCRSQSEYDYITDQKAYLSEKYTHYKWKEDIYPAPRPPQIDWC